MAAKAYKYATVDAAANFLVSEGFKYVTINQRWEVDMSNDGGGKECATIEQRPNGEFYIKDWHQD